MIKKFPLFLIALLAVAMIVSGCGKKQTQDIQPAANNQQGDQKQIQNQDQQTEEPKVITSNIDISGWKTYRSEDLRFEIKYPAGWNYKINSNGLIEFSDGHKHYYEESEISLITIYVNKISDSFLIDEWEKTKKDRGGVVQDININGMNAIQGSDYLSVCTIIDHDKNRYIITKPNIDLDEAEGVYDGMLSSLKFVL